MCTVILAQWFPNWGPGLPGGPQRYCRGQPEVVHISISVFLCGVEKNNTKQFIANSLLFMFFNFKFLEKYFT